MTSTKEEKVGRVYISGENEGAELKLVFVRSNTFCNSDFPMYSLVMFKDIDAFCL